MNKILTTLTLAMLVLSSAAQSIYTPKFEHLDEEFENIYSEKIFSDSLSSSFLIIIRKSVKLHKHVGHTEHVYVLEGTGEMMLGEEHVSVAKGDLVIIPKGTPHSLEVTSMDPMRIISVQSPKFEGKDRVFIE